MLAEHVSIRSFPGSIASGIALFALAASAGCVSSSKYSALEAERDALARDRMQLEGQVNAMTASQQQLVRDVEAKNLQIAELTKVSQRLSDELDTEVAMRQVDIERLADGIRLNVSDQLLFPSGSAELDANGQAVLKRIAKELDPARQIIAVVGHTDSYMLPERLRSQFATNWELAAARATIVVRALSEAGITPTSLRAVSRGPFDPVASNETRQGRALNRRTEIIIRQDPHAK
jgi:chemotaxis protein MotB